MSLFPVISKVRGRRLVLAGEIVSCTLLFLGLVGVLRTNLETTQELTIVTVHPVSAVAWLVLGLVGVAMSTDARRAQAYLAATGALLTLWGVLCLALGGSPSEVFARDPALVALLLAGGVASLAVALVPPATRLDRALG